MIVFFNIKMKKLNTILTFIRDFKTNILSKLHIKVTEVNLKMWSL